MLRVALDDGPAVTMLIDALDEYTIPTDKPTPYLVDWLIRNELPRHVAIAAATRPMHPYAQRLADRSRGATPSDWTNETTRPKRPSNATGNTTDLCWAWKVRLCTKWHRPVGPDFYKHPSNGKSGMGNLGARGIRDIHVGNLLS